MIRLSAAAVSVAAIVTTSAHGGAGETSYVGSGHWLAGNAYGACPKTHLVDTEIPCRVRATSKVTRYDPVVRAGVVVEMCTNAFTVGLSGPSVTVTPGCHADFEAGVVAAGSVPSLSLEEQAYEISTGACAGLALVGPTVTFTDGLAGTHTISVRVFQKGQALTYEGEHVYVDGTQVVHTAGELTLTCQTPRTPPDTLDFAGTFTGEYDLV